MKSYQIQLFLLLTFALISSAGVFAQVPTPAHVVIVIEENHDYTQIIGSAAAPFINALAADSAAALFTQSYALTHPSQPNYIMLFSGSNQGVIDDNLPRRVNRQCERATWQDIVALAQDRNRRLPVRQAGNSIAISPRGKTQLRCDKPVVKRNTPQSTIITHHQQERTHQ
jgi:hypothetical protein